MEFTRTRFNPGQPDPQGRVTRDFGDPQNGGSTYTYTDALVLAVNVALAVGRPLLLSGEPGCGKTTLARNIALVKFWAFYHQNIGSRTQASDLLWEFDALRRLNDANVRERNVLPDSHYVEPGKLWWALAPQSAARRGDPAYTATPDAPAPADPAEFQAQTPRLKPGFEASQYALPDHYEPPLHTRPGAVLLIDEIDKAEPDVPNDLLEVLDTRSFSVKGRRVQAERARDDVLVVITTNRERELPGAFMRRCVVYAFPETDAGWFAALAKQRYPGVDAALVDAVEAHFIARRGEPATRDGRRVPGAAEFLDAIAALQGLGLNQAQGAAWDVVERCLFGKEASLVSV